MTKVKLLSSLTAPFLLLSSYVSYASPTINEPSCDPGVIEYIRYDFDGNNHIIVIKLDSIGNENYTNSEKLLQPLIYAYATGAKVTLHTSDCTTGDTGFSQFTLNNK